MESDTCKVLALTACMALSFLLSGMEAGVLALNRLRIRRLMRGGDRRAAVLNRYLDNSEDFLWTILVGNTIANFAIFCLVAVELSGWLAGHRVWRVVSFVAAVFLFYILCELLPKVLFQRLPNRLTLLFARPFRFVHLTFTPVVAVVAWLSRGLLRWSGGKTSAGGLFGNRDELRFLIQESGPGLTTEEKAMINRVLDLQNLHVRQVAVPMASAITVTRETSMAKVLALCLERNLTRVPVVQESGGRIVGIIDLDKVLFLSDLDPARPAVDYADPPLFLDEGLLLEEALGRMQRNGVRLAITVSRDQRETGLVSLQDVLKVIFGDVTL